MSTAGSAAAAPPAAPTDMGELGDSPVPSHDLNTVEGLEAELGLEPAAAPAGDKAPPAEKVAAKTEEKPDAKTDPPAEDDETVVRGIMARAAARRRAAAAQRTPAAAAPAPITAKPPEPASAAAPAPPPAGVADAVSDVLRQIAKLAGDDEAAAADAAATGAPDPDKAARAAELAGLKAVVEQLGDGIKEHETALKTRLDKAEQVIEHIENTRVVREIITKKFERLSPELPALSARPDAVALIERAVARYWDAYQANPKKYLPVPPVGAIARRIEKKLAGETPTKSGTEKHTQTKKTVSSSLGSPPAARSGPDTRTKKELERDLYLTLGAPVDDDSFD